MSEYLLEMKNISKEFSGVWVLQDVNLTLKKGEVHVLMGRNGSGKSTLALTLMGHPKYTISEGNIILNKKPITKMSTDERSKSGLFLAFQAPVKIPGVSITNFRAPVTKEMC